MNSFWRNKANWAKSAYNTRRCLVECAIGDLGTIAFFQLSDQQLPTMFIMLLATINGLLTSILFETVILLRSDFKLLSALKTALGMNFVSMLVMETSMNVTDYLLTGGAILTWTVTLFVLLVGFLIPWPYNYWRLQKKGLSCH